MISCEGFERSACYPVQVLLKDLFAELRKTMKISKNSVLAAVISSDHL
jgi:hypothetical protein